MQEEIPFLLMVLMVDAATFKVIHSPVSGIKTSWSEGWGKNDASFSC